MLLLIDVGVDRSERDAGKSDEEKDVLPRFRGSVTASAAARPRTGVLGGEGRWIRNIMIL